jgi:taurine transport system substrate-binding protein
MVVPWRYAQDTQQLEQKTGYKITYRKLASGADVIRALASGAVQIGEAGSAPIASGLSQGLDIQLFWILDNINDAEALVVRNGSGVKSLADLNGKRIAVPFVSTSHFHTLLALEHAGIDPRNVKVVNILLRILCVTPWHHHVLIGNNDFLALRKCARQHCQCRCKKDRNAQYVFHGMRTGNG